MEGRQEVRVGKVARAGMAVAKVLKEAAKVALVVPEVPSSEESAV